MSASASTWRGASWWRGSACGASGRARVCAASIAGQAASRPEEYVGRVVRGELKDPTLSFQMREGFDVVAVVHRYLRNDPESEGYAAIIEWLNPEVARPEDAEGRDPRYFRPQPS